MKQTLAKATTSKLIRFLVKNSTTGAYMTGISYNASGLKVVYFREGDTSVTSVTLVSGTVGSWTSGGWVEVDSTNLPGVYELGVPNACFASGNSFIIAVAGVANMYCDPVEIETTAFDNQDSTRAGLSALPNANAAASGGLITYGTGSGQLTSDGAGNVLLSNGSGYGQVTFTNGVISANVTQIDGQTATAAAPVTFPASIGTSTYAGGAVASVTGNVGGSVASVTAGVTVTTNNDKTGYSLASAPPTTSQIAAAVLKTPANLLATDSSGNVAANNLPTDYLSSTEQTQLSTAASYSVPTAVSIAEAVWSATTRTLTAISDSPGVTTLLSRIGQALGFDGTGNVKSTPQTAVTLSDTDTTATTVANNLDAKVSTRLATSSYTAPDNVDIASIKTTTDMFRFDGNSNVASTPQTDVILASGQNIAANNLPTDYLSGTEQAQLSTAASYSVPTAAAIATAVWSAATRTLTAFSDSSGVTTLLSRIGQALGFDTNGNVKSAPQTTVTLAGGQNIAANNLPADYLSSAEQSQLQTAAAISPPSAATIATAVWASATRTLTAISDSSGVTTLLSRIGQALGFDTGGNVKSTPQTAVTISSTDTTAETVQAINSQTDQLSFAGGNVNANATIDPTVLEEAVTTAVEAVFGPGGTGGPVVAQDVWQYTNRTLTTPPNGTTPYDPAAPNEYNFSVGDNLPALSEQFLDRGGSPIDLTGATVKILVGTAINTPPKVSNTNVTIATPATGQVTYEFTPTDMTALGQGQFIGMFVATLSNGQQVSLPQQGFLSINIQGQP
jgi:hypothetical protein